MNNLDECKGFKSGEVAKVANTSKGYRKGYGSKSNLMIIDESTSIYPDKVFYGDPIPNGKSIVNTIDVNKELSTDQGSKPGATKTIVFDNPSGIIYNDDPVSITEEIPEDDLKRKVIELEDQLKEYKRNIQIAMTALDLAIEDLKVSDIDLGTLEKRGNDPHEWLYAKLHDGLMSYYLYKAEDKTQ